jgi:hypothetical protein
MSTTLAMYAASSDESGQPFAAAADLEGAVIAEKTPFGSASVLTPSIF